MRDNNSCCVCNTLYLVYWLQPALAVPTRKPTTHRRARIACSDMGTVVGVVGRGLGKGSALATVVTPNCAPSPCQKINLVQPQPVLRHQNRLHACLIITRTTSRVCGGGSVASVGVGSCAHPRLIVRYCVLQQPLTLHCMYTLMLCCLRYCTNKL